MTEDRDRQDQIAAIKLVLGVVAGGLLILVLIVAGIRHVIKTSPPQQTTTPVTSAQPSAPEPSILVVGSTTPASPTVAAAPVLSQHEQRLAELRKKRESLSFFLAMQIEDAKYLQKQAMDLSLNPVPDPDKREWLMGRMNEVTAKANQITEQIKALDAEIAETEP